ncbi:MAG: DeoR/GlpR family DNA-binding transcription regulator [Sulfitobacter sp.]
MPNTDSHSTHREVELLETLRSHGGSARTSNLAETLNVSEETVRRTVKALAKAGLVQRAHGGVYLSNTEAQAPVGTRLEKRSKAKGQIAAAAAGLIPNGSCVFLDVGSTTAHVAESLRAHRNLTIVTNGFHAARALVDRNDNQVFMAGGELRHLESGTFGSDTIAFVEKFNIDFAVISIDGFDSSTGFLLAGSAEAALARVVTQRARRVIVVTDVVKFGQSAPMIACDPTDVDTILIDKMPGDQFCEQLNAWDIEINVVASEKGDKGR